MGDCPLSNNVDMPLHLITETVTTYEIVITMQSNNKMPQ